jgi:modulator of FtsH protease
MQFPVGFLGMLVIMVAAIGLLFATRAYSNSGVGVLMVFGFTGLMGFSLGPTMNHYLSLPNGSEIVGTALLATGAAFLGLSAYVQVTKKDFAFLGGFLMVGLVGLIVVGLVGLFVPMPGLSLAISYFSVLVFGGYILYDTSEIISGRQTNYIMATISLYLDILNMFTSMLRIVTGSRD